MRRSGSPFTGAGIVLAKEAADQLSGVRMVVIEALVFLIALVLAWFSTTAIRESIGQSPFLFLRLLTMAPEPIPFSFIDTVGLVAPVIAIALLAAPALPASAAARPATTPTVVYVLMRVVLCNRQTAAVVAPPNRLVRWKRPCSSCRCRPMTCVRP